MLVKRFVGLLMALIMLATPTQSVDASRMIPGPFPSSGPYATAGQGQGAKSTPAAVTPTPQPSTAAETDASAHKPVFSLTPTPAVTPMPAADKLVALTFDDGPHKTHTAALLDVLKATGVKATFFLIGKNIPGNEALVKRMAQEGHEIGNHTYSHKKLTRLTEAAIRSQIDDTAALVTEITGSAPALMRPPGGSENKHVLAAVDMPIILWSVDPRDWSVKNEGSVYSSVMREIEPGSIVLLHDVYGTSVEAARRLIPALQRQGYRFVTVSGLLKEKYGEIEKKVYRK